MKNLRAALDAKRISVIAFAALLGISEKTARNKLNGDTDFTLGEAIKIKTELLPEYDLFYLFERDDDVA